MFRRNLDVSETIEFCHSRNVTRHTWRWRKIANTRGERRETRVVDANRGRCFSTDGVIESIYRGHRWPFTDGRTSRNASYDTLKDSSLMCQPHTLDFVPSLLNFRAPPQTSRMHDRVRILFSLDFSWNVPQSLYDNHCYQSDIDTQTSNLFNNERSPRHPSRPNLVVTLRVASVAWCFLSFLKRCWFWCTRRQRY